MPRLAVFCYASLVSPASASETLGRPVERIHPARLHGWRRRWSQARDNRLVEKTFADADSGEIPPFILGLNIEPSEGEDPAEAPNGALIELTESELDRLDVREIRYERVDVTDQVGLGTPEATNFDRVLAYTARRAHYAPEPPDGAVIVAAYARTVERCFAELGPAQRDLYLQTTGPPPVELVEAVLVRDCIPPGNPREW